MKKYFCLLFVVFLLSLCHQAIADEVKEKTDSSFIGDNPQKPINSSFVGDISNSMVNVSFSGDDVRQKTDHPFVGTDEIKEDNSLFAGRDFDKAVREGKDAPFAGERTKDDDSYGK